MSLCAWDAQVEFAPPWLASWVQRLNRTRHSSSKLVLDTWDVCINELSMVPFAVREQLRAHCSLGNIDAAWDYWSLEIGAGLLRAFSLAGSPFCLALRWTMSWRFFSSAPRFLQSCSSGVGSHLLRTYFLVCLLMESRRPDGGPCMLDGELCAALVLMDPLPQSFLTFTRLSQHFGPTIPSVQGGFANFVSPSPCLVCEGRFLPTMMRSSRKPGCPTPRGKGILWLPLRLS